MTTVYPGDADEALNAVNRVNGAIHVTDATHVRTCRTRVSHGSDSGGADYESLFQRKLTYETGFSDSVHCVDCFLSPSMSADSEWLCPETLPALTCSGPGRIPFYYEVFFAPTDP